MRDADSRPEYHYVLIDYICKVIGGALCAGSDCSRAEWVAEEELKTYQITQGTIEVIHRAFGKRTPRRRDAEKD